MGYRSLESCPPTLVCPISRPSQDLAEAASIKARTVFFRQSDDEDDEEVENHNGQLHQQGVRRLRHGLTSFEENSFLVYMFIHVLSNISKFCYFFSF